MKSSPLILLLLLVTNCFPFKKSEAPKDITKVVADTPATKISANGPVQTEKNSDSTIVLSEFVQDPFLADFSYLKNILTSKGVAIRDSSFNGISYLLFENSHVDMLINEIYGNLLCSAEISSTDFPMNQGIYIGMLKSSFKRLADVDESGFIHETSTGKSSYEYTVGKENYWRAIFWFDPKRLVKIKYEIHPCVISD